MALRRILAGSVWGALLTAAATGQQPEVNPPNFMVELHAQVMTLAENPSMAADRFGNIYIRNQPNITSVSGVIHKVDASGNAPTSWFVSGLGRLSQVAYNPADGFCHVAAHSASLTPVLSTVYRIDPVAGAVLVSTVDVIAEGFTIDDAGTMYFGSGAGVPGAGLYAHDPAGLPGNATFLSPGHASNAILASLVSGDVLIAGGDDVRRWVTGSSATLPYYTDPEPTGHSIIQSLVRTPFNQLGVGALVGVRDFSGDCVCFNGRTIAVGLLGQPVIDFASEPFGTYGDSGLKAIASGPRQELWWLTDQSLPLGPMPLYRIQQVPAHGSQGSMIVTVGAGQVTLDTYGPSGGGDPFLLGAIISPPPADVSIFVPPFGIVDLSPFSPQYFPILDGVGLFGLASPGAQIPVGGHFQLSVPVPPVLGIALELQALILSQTTAPNGLFFITNVAPLML